MTRYVDTDNRDLKAQIVYLEARIEALTRRNIELEKLIDKQKSSLLDCYQDLSQSAKEE